MNVGGANRCRPALIAQKLAKYGVINIGAVGTFVVREDVAEAVLRTAIAQQLPFKCEIMICPARDIIKLMSKDPFSRQPSGPDIVRFVGVAAKRLPAPPLLPLSLPSDDDWLLKIIAIEGRFVLGLYRRQMKAVGHLGKIEKHLGVAINHAQLNISKSAKFFARIPGPEASFGKPFCGDKARERFSRPGRTSREPSGVPRILCSFSLFCVFLPAWEESGRPAVSWRTASAPATRCKSHPSSARPREFPYPFTIRLPERIFVSSAGQTRSPRNTPALLMASAVFAPPGASFITAVTRSLLVDLAYQQALVLGSPEHRRANPWPGFAGPVTGIVNGYYPYLSSSA